MHALAPALSRTSRLVRRTGILDLALVVLAFLFYSAVRELVAGREGEATAHAMRLIEMEQSLGVFREGTLQEFTLSSAALTKAFNWVYAYGFFPPI